MAIVSMFTMSIVLAGALLRPVLVLIGALLAGRYISRLGSAAQLSF